MIDQIELAPNQRASNIEAESERISQIVEKYLRATGYPALREISCSFHDGELVLNGRLPSFYMKQVAHSAVKRIKEVESIDDRLDVE